MTYSKFFSYLKFTFQVKLPAALNLAMKVTAPVRSFETTEPLLLRPRPRVWTGVPYLVRGRQQFLYERQRAVIKLVARLTLQKLAINKNFYDIWALFAILKLKLC